MRRGELLGLRWSDVDLDKAKLTVNQSLERLAGKTVFKSPKTTGSRRTITLPALTVEALSAHRAEQARIGWARSLSSLMPMGPLGPRHAHESL